MTTRTTTQRLHTPLLYLASASMAMPLLAGCGGDGRPTGRASLPLAPRTISGTVSGIPPGGLLQLQQNGADTVTVRENGTFSFARTVPTGSSYAVTVARHPAWQGCTVTDGSGTAAADVTDVQVTCAAVDAQVTTLAGSGIAGWVDGVGSAAQFRSPYGIALDAAGTVYVADTSNHRIRKVTPDGTVSTLAGSGTEGQADGSGIAAQFNFPFGIATDTDGNVYIGDSNNNLIRKMTPDGTVSTLAGSGVAGYADGDGSVAQFSGPFGVTTDASGNIYVAEFLNNRIRKVAPNGSVSTLAGSGDTSFADGSGDAAQFAAPADVAIDTDGNVYVADYFNYRIRKVAPDGTVSTLAGSGTSGYADGNGSTAQFGDAFGVAVDSEGNVYVADSSNHRIRMIAPDGTVSTLAGSGTAGFADGSGSAAQFNSPYGVAVDADGNVYVVDNRNNAIRKLTPAR